MTTILIPVDGSGTSARVLASLPSRLARYRDDAVVHVLNVQPPVPHDVSRFLGHDKLTEFHREEGTKALAGVLAGLASAGIAATPHVLVSDDAAGAIVGFASDHRCDEILMTTHGHGALGKLFLGSVAADVIRLADVPVTLVK